MSFSPGLIFEVDLVLEEEDGDFIVGVNGEKVNLSDVGTKVRVVGPRDRRTCELCIPWIGKVFDMDDPQIQMFREGGVHPNCRHYLVPVGVPGLDRKYKGQGLTFVEGLVRKRSVKRLQEIYGQEKGRMLADGEVLVEDIYREDGTVKRLDQLDSAKAKALEAKEA